MALFRSASILRRLANTGILPSRFLWQRWGIRLAAGRKRNFSLDSSLAMGWVLNICLYHFFQVHCVHPVRAVDLDHCMRLLYIGTSSRCQSALVSLISLLESNLIAVVVGPPRLVIVLELPTRSLRNFQVIVIIAVTKGHILFCRRSRRITWFPAQLLYGFIFTLER